MKKILTVVFLVLFTASVLASSPYLPDQSPHETYESLGNRAIYRNGDLTVVLTQKECFVQTLPDHLFLAYATNGTKEYVFGCWAVVSGKVQVVWITREGEAVGVVFDPRSFEVQKVL